MSERLQSGSVEEKPLAKFIETNTNMLVRTYSEWRLNGINLFYLVPPR